MTFLSNLKIRQKFLLIPLFAAILMIILGVYSVTILESEKKLLGQLATKPIGELQELSRIFSQFSSNHVAFINLLGESALGQTSEAELYARGRSNISSINKTMSLLSAFGENFELSQKAEMIYKELTASVKAYRDEVGNAVLMSSVNLELIQKLQLHANKSYDKTNEIFLRLVRDVQRESLEVVSNAQKELDRSSRYLISVISIIISVVVAISLLLSNLFSSDLNSIIKVLSKLSKGTTDISLPSPNRRDEFGGVGNVIGVFRDALVRRSEVEKELREEIEGRIQVEKSLRTSEERFRLLFDENPLTLITVDTTGAILSINRFGAEQLGWTKEELVGGRMLNTVMQEDAGYAQTMVNCCFAEPDEKHQWELRRRCKDGSLLWMRETGHVMHDDGKYSLLIACEDITESQKLAEELSYQAKHDPITGLINRWEFEHKIEKALYVAKKNKVEHALCYIDLDQFKVINDTCGHAAGDELLRRLASLINTSIRASDTLGRLGGDEFGVLMEACSLSNGWRGANNILKALQSFHFDWGGRVFKIGASIGIVPINEASFDITSILADADTACYEAKDEGRNRVHVYSEDNVQLVKRRGEMHWASVIPQALEEDRFQLFYQTIAPLANPSQDGLRVELLVRLIGEDGALYSPGAFFPAAERYSISDKIDRWVIKNAMRWLADMPKGKEGIRLCSINLSGQTLGSERFLEYTLAQLDETQVPASMICFEITETAAITNLVKAREFMAKLKERGAFFALDDFGAGLSSFGYLRNLPVDILKIDGMFVENMHNDPIHHAMVKSINDVGHVMGMQTIAEFVESKEALEQLRELNVDYVQGYYIGKPSSIEDEQMRRLMSTKQRGSGSSSSGLSFKSIS